MVQAGHYMDDGSGLSGVESLHGSAEKGKAPAEALLRAETLKRKCIKVQLPGRPLWLGVPQMGPSMLAGPGWHDGGRAAWTSTLCGRLSLSAIRLAQQCWAAVWGTSHRL